MRHSPLSHRSRIAKRLWTYCQEALTPLGFNAGPITNVRPNGFFRVTYTATDGVDILVRGPIACVTVSIYTMLNGVDPNQAESRAKNIQQVLVDHLRTASDGTIIPFSSMSDAPCTHAL